MNANKLQRKKFKYKMVGFVGQLNLIGELILSCLNHIQPVGGPFGPQFNKLNLWLLGFYLASPKYTQGPFYGHIPPPPPLDNIS
jgi:hypothetical protein